MPLDPKSGTDLPEQQIPTNEIPAGETGVRETVSDKEKPTVQGQGIIAAVRSKILEKDAQPEDEATLGNLKIQKGSGSKISKFLKLKKSKSRTGEITDSEADNVMIAPVATSPVENFLLEEQKDSLMESKSKHTLIPKKSKSKRLLSVSEDTKMNPTQLDPKKALNDDAQSTFVISHEVEALKEQKTSISLSGADTGKDSAKSVSSQKSFLERGNFLSGGAPQPLDDFPLDQEENEERKEE